MKTLLSTAFTLLALATVAQGQIDSTSAPSDTYIDNVVNSATVGAAKEQVQATGGPPLSALRPIAKSLFLSPTQESQVELEVVTPPENKPFWSKKTLSFTYGFNDTNSKLSDGAETEINMAKSELYLESKTKFGLTTSFTFQNFSKTDNLGNLSDTNVYGFALQPSQELFHLFDVEAMCKGQLVAALGLGYSRFEGDSTGPTGTTSSDADAFSISPSLVYVRPLEGTAWTVAVSPTYTMQWKNTTVARMPDVSTNAGLFSLLGRVDRKLTPNCTASLSATWKHDVNQKVAPGKAAVYRDWAEFGMAIRYEINNSLGIKLGYSYEAFRPDYDTHKVTATGVITF